MSDPKEIRPMTDEEMRNCFCGGPDLTGKCVCRRSNSLVKELKAQLEQTAELLSIQKTLYVDALKLHTQMEEKLKENGLYWYNQGYFDALMEMNEEQKEKNDD